jgi:hypothetical protein
LCFQVKYFGDTINQLIQRENDRLTIRGKRKHKVKRNRTKIRGPRQTSTLSNLPTPIPNPLNDPNRLSSSTSINSSLLPPNTFTGIQSTMPPTATRNPSVSITSKKPAGSTLAGLLTPTTTSGYPTGGVLAAPNGTSQFGNMYSGQNLLSDSTVGKQVQATKNTTPMTGISAGLANRGSGKGGRGGGAGGAGPKRLVETCFKEVIGCVYYLEHQRKIQQLQCKRIRMFNQLYQHLILRLKRIRNQ